MTALLLLLIAIVVCLALSFIFSGAEVAVVSVNRYRLRSLHEQGDATAGKLLGLLADSQRLLVMVLIGVNMANVLSALLFEAMLTRWLTGGDRLVFGMVKLSEVLSLFVLTPLLIVFAEILPKAIFRAHADQMFGSLQNFFRLGLFLFKPVIVTIQWLASWVIGSHVGTRSRAMRQLTRQDVINLIVPEDRVEEEPAAEAGTPGDLLGHAIEQQFGREREQMEEGADERRMIQNIIQLQETRAYEIMTPLAELVAVQVGRTDLEAFKGLARSSGYSRFPVYRDRIIRLVGVIDVYRVLHEDDGTKRLEDFVEPAYYVPDTKRVDDLLQKFLAERIKNAVVVDEFGGCVGWISREDILEEIVGELEDELDVPQRRISEQPDGSFLVEGRTEVDRINEALDTDFDDEEWETLAGMLLDQMGRIPKVGDEVTVDGWRARVERMEGMRIDLVRLKRE